MIAETQTVEMQNTSLEVPGKIKVTRLTNGKIKLAHQFDLEQYTLTGATCVLLPGAAKALADGIVSLLED